MDRNVISGWFRQLQDEICNGLETLDRQGNFTKDSWTREQGGGGLSRVLSDGELIEKGGVNFSEVFGEAPSFLKKEYGPKHDEQFFATGVSIVLHPQSPMVPVIHMNVRYFEMGSDSWFGGGIDVTPHYVFDEDAISFHRGLKSICDKFSSEYYSQFSRWADDYFFIPHRDETRGIGGIFFDRLSADSDFSLEDRFEFVKEIGNFFLPSYTSLTEKNRKKSFGEKEREWMLIRRGRYVEFNLAYDKGTRFGLESGGRTESILMSLPKEVKWMYNYNPPKGSDEEVTLSKLRKNMNWAERKTST